MIEGDDLRAMRVNAGISQDAMAKKLKCDRKTIINYELDVSDIRSKQLFLWFLYCKINAGSLLNEIKQIRDITNSKEKPNLQDEEP
ncbi:helix-turn-helix domain-containing protein [Pseudoalteromonas aurantia]|uniref:XRE family transcriptional regulator n=1 Tax=Pseudoalteromonas aurantia TaxID=43654 RepID=A0ABY2VRZ4_9GAMM|nr:helix-turn-helix transcriptional regulator [Pseudoalteromonas aurantia]TMO54278.1 XRE family transcriptional regulator [Pseudoalteromonas aurantia]TMO69054.1 XRE family transcriptional regulator [Pseudoalteromonas aurantia]